MVDEITLTRFGSPVCAGEISLKQINENKPHNKIILTLNRDAQDDQLCLSEYHGNRDHNSGFYNAAYDIDSQIQIILPPAMSQFILSYLGNHSPYKKEVCDFISESNESNITTMGYANHNTYSKKETNLTIYHITRSSLSINPFKNGIQFHLLADARNKDTQEKDTIEAQFFMNETTARFRFNGTMQAQKSRPSLRRAYAGNEVNTDIDHLNLKHPIIHNTGGTFALSNSGLHAIKFNKTNTMIFPTSLEGTSWGSVYESPNIRSQIDAEKNNINPATHEIKNALTLNMITKPFLEALLHISGYIEDDKLKANLYLQKGDIGTFGQAGPTPINIRTIETIMINLTVDRFGLDIALDAQLSDIQKESYVVDLNPSQSAIYQKNILLPWEVLICRNINMGRFIRYWHTERHTMKHKKNSRLMAMFYKKPRTIPFQI